MAPQRRSFATGAVPRALGVIGCALSWGATASALDTPPIDGDPAQVAITESVRVIQNFDNRNSRGDVASAADDDWGVLSNTVDASASWRSWQLGLRLDSAWFFAAPGPTQIALRLLNERGSGSDGYDAEDGASFVRQLAMAGNELSDRYVHWNTPSRFFVGYSTPAIELTLGDFYAQFGRGLVLSVRKEDELSADTTIRGARVTGRIRGEPLRVKLTGLAGTANPLRVDLASGRHLGTTSSVREGLSRFTELGMPYRVSSDLVPDPPPNFAPDTILGVEAEFRAKPLALSIAGSRVLRQCYDVGRGCESLSADLVRSAGTLDTAGAALDVPNLGEMGALYVEYAHQRLHDFRTLDAVADQSVEGDALYASWNLHVDPATITVEGKHYRRFYPLAANVDIGQAREFSTVQYNSPPTTLPVYNDTEFEGFNTCVTGGRARVDLQVADRQSVFGWLGRYDSWAESAAAGTCDTSDQNLNSVWDLGQGTQLSFQDRSHAEIMVGARFDDTQRRLSDADGNPTEVFYRELYTRYDWVIQLPAQNALQFQGWHRRRRQTLGGPVEPWLQGTTSTSFQWGPQLNLAFGFEYDENPAFPDLYFNGQVRYELRDRLTWAPWVTGPASLMLFAGQRQGGLRCVSGICRVFPPFEGVRLDLSVGF